MKHDLFSSDELSPGTLRRVLVDGIAVVVLRTSAGELHALRDICPHLGARLSGGWLTPLVDGDDVDNRWLTDRTMLRCPWHGYEFDVDTGRCVADPEHVRVKAYGVAVEDGRVVLER